MPVVPFARTPSGSALPSTQGIDPTMFVMAAAELHEAGRLVEPEYRDGNSGSQPRIPEARPLASFGGRSIIETNHPELGPSEAELNRRKDEMEARRQRDRK